MHSTSFLLCLSAAIYLLLFIHACIRNNLTRMLGAAVMLVAVLTEYQVEPYFPRSFVPTSGLQLAVDASLFSLLTVGFILYMWRPKAA